MKLPPKQEARATQLIVECGEAWMCPLCGKVEDDDFDWIPYIKKCPKGIAKCERASPVMLTPELTPAQY